MPVTNDQIEAAAYRFNIAKGDLNYLIALGESPGVVEMLNAGDDYDYFGSLAEHECHLARLAEVKDAESLVDACIGLRDCGYADPSVVEKLKAAAQIVGDPSLISNIETCTEQNELLDTILIGYGFGSQHMVVWQMDGAALVRIPGRLLGAAA